MTLSAEDRDVVAAMEIRESHLRNRLHAAEMIDYRVRRFRLVFAALAALIGALISLVVFRIALMWVPDPRDWWVPGLVNLLFATWLGAQVGGDLLRTPIGIRVLARRRRRAERAFAQDLYAGRRWLQFSYRGEDIGPYVPQILHFLEQGRFDSVDEALALARASRRENSDAAARALERFTALAVIAEKVVIASVGESGRPSSRVMSYAVSDRPELWYVTTPPNSPKVAEFDRGMVALLTVPTLLGATITSNNVRITRAATPFVTVAELFRVQVPGYVDAMSADEQAAELVFELHLGSAKVETWVDADLVEFPAWDRS